MFLIRPDVESVSDPTLQEWMREGEAAGFLPGTFAIWDAKTATEAFEKYVDTGDAMTGLVYKVTEVIAGDSAEFVVEERVVQVHGGG